MKLIKGDIFKVNFKENKNFFFQYLGDDENCLNGNVIRVFDFETEYIQPKLKSILESSVKFNTHVFIDNGIEENVYERIGSEKLPRKFEMPIFKHYEAIDFIPQVKTGWTVWQVGGSKEYLGKVELPEKYRNIPFDGVKSSEAIIEWYETGKDPFKRKIS